MKITHRTPPGAGSIKKRILLLRQQVDDGETELTALNYLNNKLKEVEKNGKVVTVLTYNEARRRVACYGQRINAERIFFVLNMSTGKRISYPNWRQLEHWGRGYLVKLSAFTGKKSADWVALVGIGIAANSDREVFPFHE
ncbi:MAG: hypothetical protein NTV48_00250 [Candidatus Vogelbacteria bacterium]|nr:hypothetical protein [Candidatus Vogelbacteria bacterium]